MYPELLAPADDGEMSGVVAQDENKYTENLVSAQVPSLSRDREIA